MNKKLTYKIVAIVSVVLIVGYLFLPIETESLTNGTVTVVKKNNLLAEKQQVVTKRESKKELKKDSVVSFLKASASAVLIAQVYAAELSFPPYSQPLQEEDFDRLNPNFFNPQAMLIDTDGTKVSASLSKYRFSYPEPIEVNIDGDNIDSASIELIDPNTKKTLLSQHFQMQEGRWKMDIAGEKDFPAELQVKVIVSVGGKSVPIVLALKYVDPVAVIEALYPAKAEDSDMVIEAKIVTKKAGLYKIRANLFDADNQPIAHIVSKKKLKVGNQKMVLKTHQSVLQGRKAPFYLTTFMVELMSPSPGVRKKFGVSAVKKFEINDFSTSSLGTTPYEASSQEKQRLILLQQMANSG
jgi:hypothetical protein